MVGFEEKVVTTLKEGLNNLFKKVKSMDAPDIIILIIFFIFLPKMYFKEDNIFLRGLILFGIFFITSLYLWFRHKQVIFKVNKKSKERRIK